MINKISKWPDPQFFLMHVILLLIIQIFILIKNDILENIKTSNNFINKFFVVILKCFCKKFIFEEKIKMYVLF